MVLPFLHPKRSAGSGVANSQKAYQQILKALKTCRNPLVVFEASGGYERGICNFLADLRVVGHE